jgi:16S rRNA (cytosine967-C5)-methyltransferase
LRAASTSADPRRLAVAILARVDARGAHAARLLSHAAPLVRELVLGVLRWQLTLDHLIQRHLHQPLEQLEAEPRAVLRTGLYEARRLDTPVAVAVAEAVRVAKLLAPRAAGLANAVLRRAVAQPWPDPEDASLPLSLRFSHPEWLVQRWLTNLGEANTVVALRASQRPAPLALLSGASQCAALVAAGVNLEPHPIVADVVLVTAGADVVAAALRERRAYAMDPTAVLAARLLPPVGGLVVDVAAAPGGKSLVLALERPSLRIVSADRSIARAAMLRRNLALAPTPPRVVVADAAAPPLGAQSCAAVVLDAPCSGTGTLRRHPEIRWRTRPTDLAALAVVQRRLAEAATRLLAPGGWLLYLTCSLEPEENAAIVAGLPLVVQPLRDLLPEGVVRVELPSGGVVIVPSAFGDGHTVHLLRRAG